MFIKKKVSFTEFNQVLNILDFIIANPEYSPYNAEDMITISYLCDGTDYIKQLQDKYNEWRTEKEKKEGNMS